MSQGFSGIPGRPYFFGPKDLLTVVELLTFMGIFSIVEVIFYQGVEGIRYERVC